MSEHQHAVFSPSSAHRWFACPGSIRESAGLPDRETPAAAEGTFLHQVATICLDRNRAARSMLGYTDMVHTLDEAQADAVQECLDYVRALRLRTTWTDLRVLVNDDVFGTLDVAGVMFQPEGDRRTHVHLVDFKFGSGVFVPAEENEQLLIYGLGFMHSPAWLQLDTVEGISYHIVQPRHRRRDELRPMVKTPKEMRAWGDKLAAHVAAAKAPDAPLVPGEHCQFCNARPHCPALRARAKAQIVHLFQDETLAEPVSTPPKPSTLSPEELAIALRAFPTLEAWITAVRAHAYAQAVGGELPPGYKLVHKFGNRKWRDEHAAALALEAYMPNGVVPFTAPKLVTPAEAERRLPKESRGVVEKLATTSVTGTVLVPETDKRPAISHADVFDDGTAFPTLDN